MSAVSYGPDSLPDPVVRSNQWLRETNGADQPNHLTGPLHWFPAATNLIAELSQKVDRGLSVRMNRLSYSCTSGSVRKPSLNGWKMKKGTKGYPRASAKRTRICVASW